MHEAGFAHWPGQIAAQTRSFEVVSSLDVVPTVSAVIGAALPTDRAYDGRDMSNVIFDRDGGKSEHKVTNPLASPRLPPLFFCASNLHCPEGRLSIRGCQPHRL